jgi:hypothetical protein
MNAHERPAAPEAGRGTPHLSGDLLGHDASGIADLIRRGFGG